MTIALVSCKNSLPWVTAAGKMGHFVNMFHPWRKMKKKKKNGRKHDVVQLCSAARSLMLPFTFHLPLGLVNALAPANAACAQSLDL